MATATAPAEDLTAAEPVRRPPKPPWWRGKILPTYTALVILYLVTPILVMVAYSFNESHARLPQVSFKWQGFTLQWYKEWNGIPGLLSAFTKTLIIAASAATVAAVVAVSRPQAARVARASAAISIFMGGSRKRHDSH